jgi:hypothetical protein
MPSLNLASRPAEFHHRPLTEPDVKLRFIRLPSDKRTPHADFPVCKEIGMLPNQSCESVTGLGLSTSKAFELPRHPSHDRLIDVSKDRTKGISREASIVFNPAPEEWIDLLGDVGQCHMGLSSEIQFPDCRAQLYDVAVGS